MMKLMCVVPEFLARFLFHEKWHIFLDRFIVKKGLLR